MSPRRPRPRCTGSPRSVGYSRIHTGVHFPGDVIVGALVGVVLAEVTTHAVESRLG